MLKLLLITFLSVLTTVFFKQDYDIKELRRLLNEGKESEKPANELFNKVGKYSGEDALLLGYKASAYALRAKYSGNPLKKLKSIKTASRIFNSSVAKDGKSLEIRFMRYAVETQTPKSLHLSKHVTEDKTMLLEALQHYPQSDLTPETARIVRDFMQQYCECTEEEKQTLNSVKL